VVAQPQGIADMIQHYRSLAWLRAQASTDHLQVEPNAGGRPQQDAAANAWHIHAFTDESATGEHLEVTYR
jgi:hypothetical protein